MLMTSGPLPTVSTSSLNAQLETVSSFTTENFLQLNLSKCEIVSFSRQSNCAQPQVSLDGATLQCKDVAKCLGYVWNSTLSSKPMIEHNITKAKMIFFCLWQYQGIPRQHLSPFVSLRDRDLCPALWM